MGTGETDRCTYVCFGDARSGLTSEADSRKHFVGVPDGAVGRCRSPRSGVARVPWPQPRPLTQAMVEPPRRRRRRSRVLVPRWGGALPHDMSFGGTGGLVVAMRQSPSPVWLLQLLRDHQFDA